MSVFLLTSYSGTPPRRAHAPPLFAILCGCLLSIALRAGAGTLEEVKEQNEQAKDLINRGDYTGALVALHEVLALKPTPLVMFNIAMCEKALSRHTDAIVSFQRYLEMETENRAINPALHDMANAALNELYKMVGRLDISDAPPEANISIDSVHRGSLPRSEPFHLMPGKHAVRVTKEGFDPLAIDVVAAAGARIVVRADLKRPLSQLQVICNEASAMVSLNGKVVGGCPYQAELPAGKYQVQVSAPGRKALTHAVNAEVGKTTVIAANLESLPQTRPPVSLSAPVPAKRRSLPPKWVLRGAVAGTIVGAVAIGIGGFVTYRWVNGYLDPVEKKQKQTEEAKSRYDEGQITGAEFDEYDKAYHAAYNKALDAERKCQVGMALGYAVGGTLLGIGGGLLINYWVKNKKGGRSYALSSYISGVALEF